MRVKWLWAAFVSVLLMMALGAVSPSKAKLRAVVEDSTTLIVLDSDSIEVFRKDISFAERILRYPQAWRLRPETIAVVFNYAVRDSVMMNPLPRAYTYLGGRSHLLVVSAKDGELFSADSPWSMISADRSVMADEKTLFILYPDVGEAIRIDLQTKGSATIALSDWGKFAYPEKEGPIGWAKAFPGNRVAIMRNGSTEGPSEVVLLSSYGQILWRHSDRSIMRSNIWVDSHNRLVICERRYFDAGSQDEECRSGICRGLQAIDEGGEVVWTVSFGRRLVRMKRIDGEKVTVLVRSLCCQPEEKHSWKRVEIDPRTGAVEEIQ